MTETETVTEVTNDIPTEACLRYAAETAVLPPREWVRLYDDVAREHRAAVWACERWLGVPVGVSYYETYCGTEGEGPEWESAAAAAGRRVYRARGRLAVAERAAARAGWCVPSAPEALRREAEEPTCVEDGLEMVLYYESVLDELCKAGLLAAVEAEREHAIRVEIAHLRVADMARERGLQGD